MGVVFVADHFNVLVGEPVNVHDLRVEFECWEGEWFSRDLETCLLEVVVVEVSITKSVDEHTGLQMAHLGHHVRQQCIGCNVEWNAKKDVGASLVELAVQATICDMKLEKGVAGHQCHLIEFPHIPRRDDDPSTVGVGFDGLNGLSNLINDSAILGFPTTPLLAIDRSQVSVFIGPLVPNADTVFLKVLDVRITFEKPCLLYTSPSPRD